METNYNNDNSRINFDLNCCKYIKRNIIKYPINNLSLENFAKFDIFILFYRSKNK